MTIYNDIERALRVDSVDSADNSTVRDVIGNKSDTDAGDSVVGINKSIEGKVDTISTSVVTDIPATLVDIKAVTDVLPDAGALTTINTAVVTDIPGTITTLNTAVVTDIPATLVDIKAVTDVLPDAGALTTINTAVVTDIPGTITTAQSDITHILNDTGTTIPGTITTLNTAVVTDIPASLVTIDTVVDTNQDFLDGTTATPNVYRREYGLTQVKEVSITAAANAGVTTVATITDQPCLIKSVTIHADAAQTADMTTAAVEGGVNQVVEFIGTTDATQANLDTADKQVGWTGAVRLAATKTIAIDLQGTGATATDLTISIEYISCVDGGYLV